MGLLAMNTFLLSQSLDLIIAFIWHVFIAFFLHKVNGRRFNWPRGIAYAVLLIVFIQLFGLLIEWSVPLFPAQTHYFIWSLHTAAPLFRNPAMMVVYSFLGIHLLNLPKQSIKNLSLVTFCVLHIPSFVLELTDALLMFFALAKELKFNTPAFNLLTVAQKTMAFLIVLAICYPLTGYIETRAHKIKTFVESDTGAQPWKTVSNYVQMFVLWVLVSCNVFFYSTEDASLYMFQYYYLAAIFVIYLLAVVLNYHLLLRDVQNRNLAKTNKMLLETISDFRGIKHDFYNILHTYSGYLALEDLAGLSRYHATLVGQTAEVNDQLSLQAAFQDSPALLGLLFSTFNYAKKLNVYFQGQRVDELKNIQMLEFDLCRVLGNLLNNAIEYAAQTKEKTVTLSVQTQAGSKAVIIISNSVDRKIDISNLFKEGYTNKAGHSGHGLAEVNKILAGYYGCTIMPNCTDDIFTMYLNAPVCTSKQACPVDDQAFCPPSFL